MAERVPGRCVNSAPSLPSKTILEQLPSPCQSRLGLHLRPPPPPSSRALPSSLSANKHKHDVGDPLTILRESSEVTFLPPNASVDGEALGLKSADDGRSPAFCSSIKTLRPMTANYVFAAWPWIVRGPSSPLRRNRGLHFPFWSTLTLSVKHRGRIHVSPERWLRR